MAAILDEAARRARGDNPRGVAGPQNETQLYQAEALVRALRDAGDNAVNYFIFITTAGHSSFEPPKPTPATDDLA